MGGGVSTSSRVDLTVRLPDGFGAAGIWWHERHEEILSVASGSIELRHPVIGYLVDGDVVNPVDRFQPVYDFYGGE